MKTSVLFFTVILISLTSVASPKINTITENKPTEKTDSIENEILGKWRSDKSLKGATLVLTQSSDKKLIMRVTFKKGSTKNERLVESKVNGKKRYDHKNIHGEYYMLENNGNLGFYDRDGKFDEATKIR